MALLEGSCHCGAVSFSVESTTPHPYMRCYCSICRKTAGGGGYAINLMGQNETLKVEGEEHVSIYRVRRDDGELSSARRHFCKHCGSALWAHDPTWPELTHPFASAIDTPLPAAPELVHILLDSKASWVPVPEGPDHSHFEGYPEESIEDWHRKRNLTTD